MKYIAWLLPLIALWTFSYVAYIIFEFEDWYFPPYLLTVIGVFCTSVALVIEYYVKRS